MRWRRVERIGGKVVRISERTQSTKGELVSASRFLARHAMYRTVRETTPASDTSYFLASEMLDFSISVEKIDPASYTIKINGGTINGTRTASVVKQGRWYSSAENVEPQPTDLRRGSDMNGYGSIVHNYNNGLQTANTDWINAINQDVEAGRYSGHWEPLVSSDGIPFVDRNPSSSYFNQPIYIFRADYIDIELAQVYAEVKVDITEVMTFDSGSSTTLNAGHRRLATIATNVRVYLDDKGIPNGTEVICDAGMAPYSGGKEDIELKCSADVEIGMADGKEQVNEYLVPVPDPDFPRGVDWKKGMNAA